MSNISEEVSKVFQDVLGVKIGEGRWKEYLTEIDNAGEPTRKHMTQILFAICEEVEMMEKKLEVKNDKPATKGHEPKVSV